jgi:stress-induced-phosphoprotein 1
MASKKKAEEFKEKGNKDFQAGKYSDSIKSYDKAIELDPSNHVYYSNRSAAYAGLGQWEKALEDGNKCIQVKADWGKGYFRKGLALQELKKYQEAVETFKKGVQVDPSNADLKQKLSEAEELSKKYKPRVNPDGSPMSPAQVAKEEGNENFKVGKIDIAVQCYTRALQLCTEKDQQDKAAIHSNRALCYAQLYNHPEVVSDCTACLLIQPNNTKALLRRALAYEALEKMEKALEDLKAAVAIEPNIPLALQAQHRITASLAKLKEREKRK